MEAWLKKYEKRVLWGSMAGFFLLVTGLCFAKYARLGYDAIDLAYFNQVFWNFVRGRFFEQSLHPHSSLGDHAELLIPLLAPFYLLWQDPRLLLAMQAAALALTAWPVWLLAKHRFSVPTNGMERTAPLLFVLVWLTGPLLQNIAFFEFHILPFALIPLLFALLAYRRDRRVAFLGWISLALLTREDVALVVMGVALLAFIEKRTWWWRTVPLALGAAWFTGAMALVKHHAPVGSYKFSIYYGWLGDSFGAMFVNAVTHPLTVIAHVATLPNLEMLLGLLMPFAFLPLLSPRALILAAGPAAQMLLGAASGGSIVIETHYSTLFLPALALATFDGYARAPALLARTFKMLSPTEIRVVIPVLLAIATIYSTLAYGPLPGAIGRIFTATDAGRIAAAQKIVSSIPADAPVAGSYALLPLLSSRQSFYSAHYLFLGKTQFGQQEYPVPDDLRYTAFELSDIVAYRGQFLITGWTAPLYAGGLGRLTAAVGNPVSRSGQVVMFDRQATLPATESIVSFADGPSDFDGFSLAGAEVSLRDGELRLKTAWGGPLPKTSDVVMTLALRDAAGKTVRTSFGAFESLPEAAPDESGTRMITLALRVDGLAPGEYAPHFSMERAAVRLLLAPDRGTEISLSDRQEIGSMVFEKIRLGE